MKYFAPVNFHAQVIEAKAIYLISQFYNFIEIEFRSLTIFEIHLYTIKHWA